MRARRWDPSDGELSEAALRERFQAPSFRVAQNVYPPGTAFSARTRACTVYVLGGALWLRSGEAGDFSAGDVLELEAGDYELEVAASGEATLVSVWNLRPHMN